MGKLAVVGASVLMGGGVSAGGVVLSKMFSFDSTLPIDLDKFKEGNGGGCVQSLFPGLEKMDGSSLQSPGSSEIKDGFLDISKKDKVSGCLVINWDKLKYNSGNETNGKEGKFRLLGAVQQESKGFIVFTTANTTDNSEKKLLGTGIAYTLSKTGETWSLSKKRDLSSSDKKMDKTSVDNKFPKAHTNLTDKQFWGFMKDKDDLDKICDTSRCTNDTQKSKVSFEGYWEGKGSSDTNGKKLGEWTSKLTEGWEELFGKTEWDMQDVVKDMTGQGEKKVGYGIDEQSPSS